MIARPFPFWILQGILVLSAGAEPSVNGFERFHSAIPTAEGGRLLFNELGCANCHGGATGLPERRGPDLESVTQRVHPSWLRTFLASPETAHAGRTMPHLLPADDKSAVEAVYHYLASLPTKPYRPTVARHVNAKRGDSLYHTIGCVACHSPGKKDLPVDGANLSQKYVLSSLSEFMLDPLKARPDGRMPRIKMELQDAVDIAGYLLDFEGSDGRQSTQLPEPKVSTELADRGRDLVKSLRCASCHALPEEVETDTVPLQQPTGGCLDLKGRTDIPRYDLSEVQRTSLTMFLSTGDEPLSSTDQVTLTLHALNCTACHQRDGQGGPDATRTAYFQGDPSIGDTGRYPPPLTGAGRKLQTDWLKKVLSGEHRVRPYLETKMPIYGAATASLAELLHEADAKPESPLPGGDDSAGRKLLGTVGGLGCITCHQWGTRPALGIQALDLSNLGQRLQPGWLRDYLINPAAHRSGTLMPSFWPDGKAANQEVLDGNTDHQIASILSFAKSANGEPEGYPDNASGEFELIPKDHPIVLRTFMQDVGTHAILIGFPAGWHLAYDGQNAQPALAWRGKFFDAYTTWFSRFAPFEKPLGDSVVKWPTEKDGRRTTVRFNGFRLDSKRVPTLLYTHSGVPIEERFDAHETGLHRTIAWDATHLSSPAISHPEGVTPIEHPESRPGNRRFTYTWE